MNELGWALIEKGVSWNDHFDLSKTLAPSPDKVIKTVATKSPIVPKAKPKKYLSNKSKSKKVTKKKKTTSFTIIPNLL